MQKTALALTLAAAMSISSCAHKRPVSKRLLLDEQAGGDWPEPQPPADRKSKPEPPPPPPASAAAAGEMEPEYAARPSRVRQVRSASEDEPIKRAGSADLVPADVAGSSAATAGERIVMPAPSPAALAQARPYVGRISQADPSGLYVSPAPLKRLRAGLSAPDQAAPASADATAPPDTPGATASPDGLPADGQLRADFSSGLIAQTMLLGSYRVQVATTPDCAIVLLDKVYPFGEDINVHEELTTWGFKDGFYWIRIAFIDLLDFQQPFSAPRPYAYRRYAQPRDRAR